jgi:nicotinamide mononucleotide (NMN) deamidase PncC
MTAQLGPGAATTEQMASAARCRFAADVGLATLGSADGDGQSPSGTIALAAAGPDRSETREIVFPLARVRFQTLAAYAGLRAVMRLLGS